MACNRPSRSLAVLDTHYAVTLSELTARASDRVFDRSVDPHPIDPHHFTNARVELQGEGLIVPTTGTTRGGGEVTTWSRVATCGLQRRTDDAAGRKRLLTARHNGWSERGGAGRGLIGKAGEDALHAALTAPGSPLTGVTGSTLHVLGLDLRKAGIGELDNSGFVIDQTHAHQPQVVTLLFENKNTRHWHTHDDDDVTVFLGKAARIQALRPDVLICPVFVCRRVGYLLWRLGMEDGFLPVRVHNQFVLPDFDLTRDAFDEVVAGLGFADMILGSEPNHRLLGMVKTSIPQRALGLAARWAVNHTRWLPRPPPRGVPVDSII